MKLLEESHVPPDAIHRICVIKPSALGDIVQSLPILGPLRHRFPHAAIHWVCNRSFCSLLEPISLIDQVHPFDRSAAGQGLWQRARQLRRFANELASQSFDLVIDLQGLLRSGLMCWTTGAKHRVGLATAREGAGLFYHSVIDDRPKRQPAVARYWRLAHQLGLGDLPIRWDFCITDQERRTAQQLLAGLRPPIVAIHPGARWLTKRWPPNHFAQTVERVLDQTGGTVVIVGAPDESSLADTILEDVHHPCRNLTGKTSLRQLAALLQASTVLLSNDSGPMHLAAALGTPTVAIFTCTSPVRAAPHGTGHRTIQTSVSCAGSYLRCCNRMDCMRDLTAEKVIPLLRQSLDQYSAQAG